MAKSKQKKANLFGTPDQLFSSISAAGNAKCINNQTKKGCGVAVDETTHPDMDKTVKVSSSGGSAVTLALLAPPSGGGGESTVAGNLSTSTIQVDCHHPEGQLKAENLLNGTTAPLKKLRRQPRVVVATESDVSQVGYGISRKFCNTIKLNSKAHCLFLQSLHEREGESLSQLGRLGLRVASPYPSSSALPMDETGTGQGAVPVRKVRRRRSRADRNRRTLERLSGVTNLTSLTTLSGPSNGM